MLLIIRPVLTSSGLVPPSSSSPGNTLLGPFKQYKTVRYGLPHTSQSASSHDFLQQKRMLAFNASARHLQASASSSRRMTSLTQPRKVSSPKLLQLSVHN
uniref:Uncharacterized protein n=1 Tax=Trichogramma kaykai TaxID=54128 RepID=A0ABD2VT75_9HYME